MTSVDYESLIELVHSGLVDISNVEREEYDGDGYAVRFDYGGLRYRLSYFFSTWKDRYVYMVEEVESPCFLVTNRRSQDIEYKIFGGLSLDVTTKPSSFTYSHP